jgi:hypothetical protein
MQLRCVLGVYALALTRFPSLAISDVDIVFWASRIRVPRTVHSKSGPLGFKKIDPLNRATSVE